MTLAPLFTPRENMAVFPYLLSVFSLFACCGILPAAIVDFTTWTPVGDPPNANFSASATTTTATLRATGGPIPPATDIAFQSVNGSTPTSSTIGHAFDSTLDFTIAIDYALNFGTNPVGILGLGFGIGEDGNGNNAAGVGFGTINGFSPLPLTGVATVARVEETPLTLGANTATLSGSLFIQYDAASGDVTVGAAPTAGAASATVSDTFGGIQKKWGGGNLLASFFLRSDQIGWQAGDAEAIFSDFRVLSGTATAVPEPTSMAACTALGMLAVHWRRKRRHPRLRPGGHRNG